MYGRLEDVIDLVCASWALDRVNGTRRDECGLGLRVFADERSSHVVGRVLEVEQEVGANTKHPSRRDLGGVDRLVLEHDTRDVDGVRVQLGAGRDRVVARLQARNGGDNHVEGDRPCRCVLRGRLSLDVVTGSELENLSELQATVVDDVVVFLLVRVEVLEERLSLRGRSELG